MTVSLSAFEGVSSQFAKINLLQLYSPCARATPSAFSIPADCSANAVIMHVPISCLTQENAEAIAFFCTLPAVAFAAYAAVKFRYASFGTVSTITNPYLVELRARWLLNQLQTTASLTKSQKGAATASGPALSVAPSESLALAQAEQQLIVFKV